MSISNGPEPTPSDAASSFQAFQSNRLTLGLALALSFGVGAYYASTYEPVTVAVVEPPVRIAPPDMRIPIAPPTESRAMANTRVDAAPLSSPTADRMVANLDRFEFDLAAIRDGAALVPRVLVDTVPVDLGSIEIVEDRKREFIRMMLPMVLVVNEKIEADRERVADLRQALEADRPVSMRERAWLEDQFVEYGVPSDDFDALLTRMDIAPPSLALAQAAIESGWGSSRFAREGNALFGQWTTEEYEGIVPASREEGKTHKIRAFDAPSDSVESYIRNLNTHRAYREFRAMRADMRARGAAIDSMRLAETLIDYSEKGPVYVDLVKSVIGVNDLRDLDKARLAPGRPLPRRSNA
ncbi:MAG: glucosaminidase domain-containing protein [Alphaproteobacteria bacterium]|nr:glucosaminidase domain-containing protein [Alphaproteobacteria bacterium]